MSSPRHEECVLSYLQSPRHEECVLSYLQFISDMLSEYTIHFDLCCHSLAVLLFVITAAAQPVQMHLHC